MLVVAGVVAPATAMAQSENTANAKSEVRAENIASPASTRALTVMKGDANGDGDFTEADVTITINYMLGKNPGDFDFAAADTNGDNAITIKDLIYIINQIPHESTIGGSIGDN